VDEVVAGSSDADADEIAEHEQIGCKEEHSEEEPTGVEVAAAVVDRNWTSLSQDASSGSQNRLS
jgi:hypothetical protein